MSSIASEFQIVAKDLKKGDIISVYRPDKFGRPNWLPITVTYACCVSSRTIMYEGMSLDRNAWNGLVIGKVPKKTIFDIPF